MGKKLNNYVLELQKLLDSGEKIENIEAFKKELLTEIEFWQHERFIHLIVTFLFALLTVALIIVSFFYTSIPMFLLLLMLMVLLVPYIKHYYTLENGTQKLYELYEEFTKRQLPNGVPKQCMP